MGKDEKKAPFLLDLGRATMRGLRKCKKCGMMNGTRGFACKNSSCDVIFKDPQNIKKADNDPCQIKTSKNVQIYSVRVRDKGPDYRGFVFLPNHQMIYPLEVNGESILESKCHIESCNRRKTVAVCQHIRAAEQCSRQSIPLVLKNSALNLLSIPTTYKEEMWQLSLDTTGPFVQRVSKSAMVVKCKADNSNPLGYLHFSFHPSKVKKDGEPKFSCSCQGFKAQGINGNSPFRHCIHLYACMVAFVSNEFLASEFSCLLDMVKQNRAFRCRSDNLRFAMKSEFSLCPGLEDVDCKAVGISSNEVDPLEEVDERSFLILDDNGSGTPCQVEVEVVDQDPMAGVSHECVDDKLEIQLQTEDSLQLRTADGGTISVHQLHDSVALSGIKRKYSDSLLDGLRNGRLNVLKKADQKKVAMSCQKKIQNPVENEQEVFTFTQWLDSVIERIEQTMHFALPVKTNHLIFHTPKVFFRCLLARINKPHAGKKAKCCHEVFCQPLGKFTKQIWKITNVPQVVNIFCSSSRQLTAVHYFTQEKNGSYKRCEKPPGQLDVARHAPLHHIKPCEYTSVLRVGSAPLTRHSAPFIIEWTPDILPESQIGELSLRYDFDQFSNGNMVSKASSHIKSDPRLGPTLAPKPPQKIAIPTSTQVGSVLTLPISQDPTTGDFTLVV